MYVRMSVCVVCVCAWVCVNVSVCVCVGEYVYVSHCACLESITLLSVCVHLCHPPISARAPMVPESSLSQWWMQGWGHLSEGSVLRRRPRPPSVRSMVRLIPEPVRSSLRYCWLLLFHIIGWVSFPVPFVVITCFFFYYRLPHTYHCHNSHHHLLFLAVVFWSTFGGL